DTRQPISPAGWAPRSGRRWPQRCRPCATAWRSLSTGGWPACCSRPSRNDWPSTPDSHRYSERGRRRRSDVRTAPAPGLGREGGPGHRGRLSVADGQVPLVRTSPAVTTEECLAHGRRDLAHRLVLPRVRLKPPLTATTEPLPGSSRRGLCCVRGQLTPASFRDHIWMAAREARNRT